MPFSRIALAPFLLVVLGACASNPNAGVKSSQAELTHEQREAEREKQELAQKHAHERADDDHDADQRRKHESERADVHAEGQRETSAAKADVQEAKVDMAQDRRDFDTRVKERLAKLDARAKEMKTKSAKLDAKKKGDFNTGYGRFTTERSDANAKVKVLSSTSNDAWSNTKKEVTDLLNRLDDSLDKLDGTL